jgi:hypothetical protein
VFGGQTSGNALRTVLWCVGAYPLGSIPTAYLVGRLTLGADIRQYGSGNMGGNDLWHAGVRWAIVPVGLFDSVAFERPPAVTWCCAATVAVTAVKRLEANRAPLPPNGERWTVLWRRLGLDRDIASHEQWVARRPPRAQPGSHASDTRGESH